ncbi:MAG: hypothetical protein SFU91_14565 [Chloroherpetonaceae bacterium]|nr:hypothetical protein [Chloroherpetonaceae bacterium]
MLYLHLSLLDFAYKSFVFIIFFHPYLSLSANLVRLCEGKWARSSPKTELNPMLVNGLDYQVNSIPIFRDFVVYPKL